MRPRRPFSSAIASESRRRMRHPASPAEFRRWQAVWLAAAEDRSNADIARITGLAVTSVRSLHARCHKDGLPALCDKKPGGRQRCHLSIEQEAVLLADFFAVAQRGGVLVVSAIQEAFEKAVGHPVHVSGIYKILHRHGWRKIVPRPRHPHGHVDQQADFKKNFRTRLRTSRTR